MATTMRKNRQTTLNRKNQLIRVNHDVREVFAVDELDRQKNHRLKQMIRMTLSIHRMTLSLSNRATQLHGVLCGHYVSREIRLMLNRRKSRKIHMSWHVNRKIRRTSQLQTGFRESSFQPKHLDMRNEQTSLQTSHLFNLYP